MAQTQNVSIYDIEYGMRILFNHIPSNTFHNAPHRLNDVNPTIVREWLQKWNPRLDTLSTSHLSSISTIRAQPHDPQQIIVDVFTWLSDLSSQYPIMWIHHQDRSQTSFFAHVIAELLDELGKLSGSFFCTKIGSGINITHIVPTLAYQLAENFSDIQSLIAQVVVQNPSIFKVQVKSQIEKLILNPLSVAFEAGILDTRGIPNVFLIHGLEEFEHADRSQLSLLYAFSDALTTLAAEGIPYRLVLVGEDSSHIKKWLSNTDLRQRVLDRLITVPVSLGEEEEDREKKREEEEREKKREQEKREKKREEEEREKKREQEKREKKREEEEREKKREEEEREKKREEEEREKKREAKKKGDVPWHPMNTLRGHTKPVTAVVFSADGTILASASYDNTVRLWEAKTGSLFAILKGHSGAVYAVAFSPDGSRLASGSYDYTVRLWDVKSRSLLTTLHGHSTLVSSVAFSPDGLRLASGSNDNAVRLWNGKTGSLVAILKGHTELAWFVTFSPDGSILASGSADHTVRLWEGKGGGLIATLKGHSQQINAVAFSPHGLTLASGSTDKTVRLWEVKTRRLVVALYGHSSQVSRVTFSSDSSILASGAFDKTVRLWDAKTGILIAILEGHSGPVHSIAFSPNGSILTSRSYDGTVRFWDIKTRSFITSFTDYCCQYFAFSPDGLSLAFTSSDNTIQIWH